MPLPGKDIPMTIFRNVRSMIPLGSRDEEKINFVRYGSSQQDTELDSFGNGSKKESRGKIMESAINEGKQETGKANGSVPPSGEVDYTGEEMNQPHTISEWQAGWNVTNAIQGMFIVSFPYAVLHGGYWAIISIVFVAYICCHTGKILIDCLYEENENGEKIRVRDSYVSIAEEVWGKKYGGKIVNVAQLIELLMTCILYVVLCGDLMIGSFPSWKIDKTSWMIICSMILIACAFLRNLRSVSWLSFWCTMAHIVINIIIFAYCLSKASSWAWSKVQIKIDIFTFPISMGIVVFSYTSQIFLPSLEGNMKNPNRFQCMLNWSHAAAALFKALFAYVGFLTWSEQTEEVITNNLPTQAFKAIVNFILVIKAMFSYPLPYYAAIHLLEASFFKGRSLTLFPSCFADDGLLKVWGLGLRIGLVAITLMLAISIPHFALLMGLIGSFTGTMLSFVWPSYFHMKLKWEELQWYIISLDVFIVCLGIICGAVGIYYSGFALIQAYRGN